MVVSSQAERLKPHAIDVRVKTDPVKWFLEGKEDTRSSYHLEDVATEFQVQGLELDWACIVWDGDLRFSHGRWAYHQFRGSRWNRVNKAERQRYLENAYRVLLTRARQGMVLVVPHGDDDDPTSSREFYDPTYCYLRSLGLQEIRHHWCAQQASFFLQIAATNIVPVMFRTSPTRPANMATDFTGSVGKPETEDCLQQLCQTRNAANEQGHPWVALFVVLSFEAVGNHHLPCRITPRMLRPATMSSKPWWTSSIL